MSRQGIDGRSRLAIWLGGVARAACGGMLGTSLSFIIGRTGSLFTVVLLGTVFFASNILFGPLWGALGDATGRRSDVLIAGSGLATLSLVGLLFAGTNRGLLGVRTPYAVFTVGFSPLLFAAVNDLVGRRNQGRTTGFLNRTFAVGDLGGQVAIGALLGLLVPSLIFVGITAVSLVGTLAVGLLNDGQRDRRPSGADASRGWLGRLVPSSDERRTLRRSQLGSVYAALTLRHATVHGIGTLVPIYLFTTLGVTRVTMGLLLAVSPAVQTSCCRSPDGWPIPVTGWPSGPPGWC